jgi:hypothetical protein
VLRAETHAVERVKCVLLIDFNHVCNVSTNLLRHGFTK